MKPADYYKILGVARDATEDEIQKAYRKLAIQYHPDRNSSPDAEDRFKEIGQAYDVLKNPESRAKYDQFGENWESIQNRGAQDPHFADELWSSIFGQAAAQNSNSGRRSGESANWDGWFSFGGSDDFGDPFGFGSEGSDPRGFGGRGPRPQTAGGAGDLQATLSLTLEDALSGGKRSVRLRDPRTGETRTYSVKVPAGIADGQTLRLKGQGETSWDGSASGDLLLTVKLQQHPRFRRKGSDLIASLPLTPWEAGLGAEVDVETLSGQTVRVRIPEGTKSGRSIRLRGLGLGPPTSRGNLILQTEITNPSDLTAREKELLEQWRDLRGKTSAAEEGGTAR